MKDKRVPETPELRSTIAALRKLASRAGTTSLPEAPTSADAKLLELCTTILEGHAEIDAIWREAQKIKPCNMFTNPVYAAEMEKRRNVRNRLLSPMIRLSKLSAKTGAGVYAKAAVLRCSRGSAERLALSLANDLTACPGLRASLWPAERA